MDFLLLVFQETSPTGCDLSAVNIVGLQAPGWAQAEQANVNAH